MGSFQDLPKELFLANCEVAFFLLSQHKRSALACLQKAVLLNGLYLEMS